MMSIQSSDHLAVRVDVSLIFTLAFIFEEAAPAAI